MTGSSQEAEVGLPLTDALRRWYRQTGGGPPVPPARSPDEGRSRLGWSTGGA